MSVGIAMTATPVADIRPPVNPARGHRGPQPPIFNPQDRLRRAEDRDQVSLPCGFSARKIPQDFQENPFPRPQGGFRRGEKFPPALSFFRLGYAEIGRHVRALAHNAQQGAAFKNAAPRCL